MKKQEFIKKLDIYLIVMRKKFMDDCGKYNELMSQSLPPIFGF